MSESVEHHSHAKQYFIIFLILAALTGVELLIPGLDIAYSIRAISLISLAIIKAIVVALYYMHLNEETTWLKFIAAIPFVAGVYAIVLMLEANYR